jgi:glycosyltransferase involved in cell wall biosynthesis
MVYQAKLKQLPVLVFFHGWSKDFEQIISKRFLWFFQHTFGQADGFIVLAKEFKYILQKWGVKQPIYLLSTAIEDSLLTNFLISEKLEQTKITPQLKVLFLARLHKEKGVFETVDAVSMLIQKGLPISLSIAGDGPIMNELRKYVSSLNIPGKSVDFLGYVKNMNKIKTFTNHHLYCLPSYSEGLPTSVLEAMAFGLPVITRPVGGLVDIFEDGKMGFLCQGKKPEEIASAIERIITNKPLMLQMSEYNHVFAKEHFMASIVTKKIFEIYNTIVEY